MAEIIVTSTADSGAGSLRQAVVDAQDGDVILFDSTVFPPETLTPIYLSSVLSVAKEVVVDGDGRVSLDGQDSVRCLTVYASMHVKNLVIRNGATANGAGVNLGGGAPTLTNCVVENCNATSACGGVYLIETVVGTLNNCTIRNCTAGTNGGGVFFNHTSQATLNNCVITNCTAGSNGGGMIAASSSQSVLNRCSIMNCTTTANGGAAYVYGSASATFVDCTASNNTSNDSQRSGIVALNTASISVGASLFDVLCIGPTAATAISDGITAVGTLVLLATTSDAPTITFADGAALTVTTDAPIQSRATFTSVGRGYLALAHGIDASGAALNGVVLCSYGAGLRSFRINAAGAAWTADDDSIPILLEQRNGDAWTTIDASATGGSYATAFGLGATARAFDGETFLTATVVFHAWLEYEQTITVATATAKVYEVAAQSTNRYKITKGFIMASQYYNRGEAPVFFARIEDSETSTIVPKSAVSAISYTAYKVTTSWSTEKRTPVEGHEEVDVPLAAYLDALVDDDPRWTEDETGYNFIFEPDTTENPIFPDGGKYVVVVTIEFTGANPAPISYEIEVK